MEETKSVVTQQDRNCVRKFSALAWPQTRDENEDCLSRKWASR